MADRNRTGVWLSWPRRVSSTRRPSMPPGSMRSRMMASKSSLAAMNKPSRPLSACSTTWPASRKPFTTKPATSLSSSTTSTRIGLLLCLLRWPAADGDRDLDGGGAAPDREAGGAARAYGRDRADQALRRLHLLAVHGGDDVTGPEPGARGGAGALDIGDGDAGVAARILHRDAKPAAL